GYVTDTRLTAFKSTTRGTSLSQVAAVASELGMKMQMARRTASGADYILPAVVHWNAGHFAALVRQEGDRFLIQDPTFGEDLWLTRKALDDETSGYYVIPQGPLPSGW